MAPTLFRFLILLLITNPLFDAYQAVTALGRGAGSSSSVFLLLLGVDAILILLLIVLWTRSKKRPFLFFIIALGFTVFIRVGTAIFAQTVVNEMLHP